MKLTLLDIVTGETQSIDSEFDAYWWSEGNGSCDCNRAILMGSDVEPACGATRFLIVRTDDESYSVREFNRDYPSPILDEYCGLEA